MEVRTLTSAPGTSLAPAAQAETPGLVQSTIARVAGVLGVFLTMLVLGFGVVIFGRQNLEVVSDTVSHSFGRAFVTGLLGQILLLPTFGMLVVGLILSVAGILLLPFAVAVFAMLVVVVRRPGDAERVRAGIENRSCGGRICQRACGGGCPSACRRRRTDSREIVSRSCSCRFSVRWVSLKPA